MRTGIALGKELRCVLSISCDGLQTSAEIGRASEGRITLGTELLIKVLAKLGSRLAKSCDDSTNPGGNSMG